MNARGFDSICGGTFVQRSGKLRAPQGCQVQTHFPIDSSFAAYTWLYAPLSTPR